MFINVDNNRDKCVIIRSGERDYLSECETPNTRKYYKLLVINTQWNLVDRFTRTKCITNSGYKYLLYLIFQRENVSYYYFWGKHQTEKYVFYYIYIYIEKPRCEPVLFPIRKNKVPFVLQITCT